jgi:flavin-dependent dehydrogenase
MAPADGWRRTKGARMVAGGGRIELSWPELSSYPGYGMVRGRPAFDEILARHAQKAGARPREGMTVTGPLLDERTSRITGVTARPADNDPVNSGGPAAAPASRTGRRFRARLVVAADGNSSRLPVSMGLRRREDRPLAVAVRTYYTSPRHAGDYLEARLDLWNGRRLLPGYGRIFGMGDGTSNVGLGLLNTSAGRRDIDYRALPRRRLAAVPAGFRLPEECRAEPVRGAALPMGFSRTPHYTRGLLLTGDAGGMVNPFNGEGIAYALETGQIAAQVITRALARPHAPATENVLQAYPAALTDAYGGYYALGRTFVQLIGNSPALMRFAARHGLKRRVMMRFAVKLPGNLTETRGGDAADRIISVLSKVTPAA